MQSYPPPKDKKRLELWHWLVLALGVGMIAYGIFKMIAPSLAPDVVPSDALPDFAVTAAAPTYGPTIEAALLAAPAPTETPSPAELAMNAEATKEAGDEVIQGLPPATPSPEPLTSTYELPARIIIPAIKVDAPVEVSSFVVKKGQSLGEWVLPMKAAGWLDNTAKLGEPGNLVMSGHNNIGSKVFANLRLLKPNDVIVVKGKTQETRYVVTERKLLLEKGQPLSVQIENASYILPDMGDTRLTLVTCWPPTNNTYRLIIIAQPQAIGSK